MPCTNDKPCEQPMLRWVHSDRCKELTQSQAKKETTRHKSMSLAQQMWFSQYLESVRVSSQNGNRFAALVDQVVKRAVHDSNMVEKMAEEVDDFTNYSLSCEKKWRKYKAHAVEMEYRFWLSSIVGAMIISMIRENISFALEKDNISTKRPESSDQHKIHALCKRIQELEQQLKDREVQNHEDNLNDIMGPVGQG